MSNSDRSTSRKAAVVLGVLLTVAVLSFYGGYSWRGISDADQDGSVTGDSYLPLIGCDSWSMEPVIQFYVRVTEDMSLKDKCDHLAAYLSRWVFSRLPIEVTSIEQRGNRQVAIINLREAEQGGGRSWRLVYFQGSTGGEVTATTLRSTFLQQDYDGEWVDGVQFFYEGEPLDNWDHIIDLEDVVWRDTI